MLRVVDFNYFSVRGVTIMGFAYTMLFYVIYKLRDVWTVKLYIVPNQCIERSILFKTVRHPNCYLNILPELIGGALLCNVWTIWTVGLPFISAFLLYTSSRKKKPWPICGKMDKKTIIHWVKIYRTRIFGRYKSH